MTGTRRLVTAAALALSIGRLLLIPGERVKRNAEVREAYEEYSYCMRIDVFCAAARPCPYLNCMGNFLRRAEEINRRHLLLSIIDHRNLLSGWQPRWYPPAP